ncbi:META domain-containing protein [Herbiconiux sp. CPCC 205763]|uniref:META domain-containing protein n=1 Tax=Herbiconiux aconitum TaxID=2970913 RepID=A0ABT2GSV3_9MICO|nr:META domain-containing protein [Herbiconiux aconitum]MCS5719226.1 META domain-containing protein [Herbiconiux aconitum]
MKLHAVTTLGLAALGLAAVMSLGACASGASSPASSPASTNGAGEADPATEADLVGAWVTSESYGSPNTPFLDFADDGTWTGSDGCNGVQGEWAVAADGSLTVSAGPSTLIACDGAALPAMLSSAAVAFIDGDSLVLADAEEEALVTLVRAPDGMVPGAGGVIGTWTADAPDGVDVFLTFTDGKVTGKDGCNNLMGSWSAGEGSSVVLSGLASTMMYCEGVDTWLSKAVGLTLDGRTAVVLDDTGTMIGTLTKQG